MENEQNVLWSLMVDRASLTVDGSSLMSRILTDYLGHNAKNYGFVKLSDQAKINELRSAEPLLYLPQVKKNGHATLDNVGKFHSQSIFISTENPNCSYKTLVTFLSQLRDPVYQIYKLGGNSSCADVIVRHKNLWVHCELKKEGRTKGVHAIVRELHKILNVVHLCDKNTEHVILISHTGQDMTVELEKVKKKLLRAANT
jgi:hypothetical protein